VENLIIKYLTDNINDDELKKLSDWLSIDENKSEFKKFVLINHKIDEIYFNKVSINKSYAKLQIYKNKKLLFYKYAATLLILLTLSIGIHYAIKKDPINLNNITLEFANGDLIEINNALKVILKEKDTICSVKNDTLIYHETKLESEKHILKVPNGKIFNLILADKSKISINSGSQLTYQTNFNNAIIRKTHLTGEAYFDVMSNKNKPFIINTPKIKIQVLGTKFNVSDYLNDNNTSVVLKEGSVRVNTANKKNEIVLKPNQQFLLTEETSHIKEVLIKKHISWKNNQLYFRNDTFNDIIKKLERHYNVKISNNSKELARVRYSGIFSNQPISKILNTFQEISNFKYTIKDKKITIYL
jgi:hypothetical protein